MSYEEPTIQETLDAFNIESVHPAAELFPLVEGDEFQQLCESIGKEGLEQDIVLTHDGRLLDGRNRLRACLVTGQTERFRTLDEAYAKDYVGFVVRMNIQRRHLSSSQRAALAAEAEALRHHEREAKERQREAAIKGNKNRHQPASPVNQKVDEPADSNESKSEQNQAQQEKPYERQAASKTAQEFGTNRQHVTDAKKLKAEDPEAFEQVKSGEKSVTQAKKQATQKKAEPAVGYITLTRWQDEGFEIVPEPQNKTQFNKQADASEQSMANIEWASWSWNPVTGCKHDCSYCYARDIAQRFYPQGFEPTIHPDRISAPYNTPVPKSADSDTAKRNVFANSMSDLYGRWVPQVWIDAVFQAMADNPQWNFLTLTKFPKRAAELSYPDNVWIGTSVDLQARVSAAEKAFEKIECGVKWLSLEPLIEPLTFKKPELFDWVVIGGASKSSQTPEWVPPADWIIRVAAQFLEHGAKIYLKTNGRPREFPGVITPENADESFHYLGSLKRVK